jgi:hypothetical protein
MYTVLHRICTQHYVLQKASASLAWLQDFNQTLVTNQPTPLQLSNQMTKPQLRRVVSDTMLRRAYGAPQSDSSNRNGSCGNMFAARKLVQAVSDDQTVLLQVLPTDTTLTASGHTAPTISAANLWQHLTSVVLAFDHVCSNQMAVKAHLQQLGLQQINTLRPIVNDAQVFSSGSVINSNTAMSAAAYDTDAIKQLASQIYAACLADLGGAVRTDYGSSTNTASYIDASYIQSVLDAYGSDSVPELIGTLWSGAVDVHPILLGLLTRLLPIQVQVRYYNNLRHIHDHYLST